VYSRDEAPQPRRSVACLLAGAGARAQAPADSSESPLASVVPASPFNEERILGVMPDYQTVRDSSIRVAPLTPKQKWDLAWKETVDPFNFASVAMAAGFSQRGDQTPKYGEGGGAYGERIGAAFADFGTQNFFSAGVLANLLHQDPRYYRKGPATGILKRVAYSVTRVAVVRTGRRRRGVQFFRRVRHDDGDRGIQPLLSFRKRQRLGNGRPLVYQPAGRRHRQRHVGVLARHSAEVLSLQIQKSGGEIT